jgi:hypothetical protein
VRAGLLSDPRVVHLLRTCFVPCMLSARNNKELLGDARDLALLESISKATGEPFQGGERELFLLPDGTPQRVFLSSHADGNSNESTHRTAAKRRTEAAVRPWRRHAEAALRAVHEDLPEPWARAWSPEAAEVAAIAAEPAHWPVPPPGEQALRVHVRNSYLLYDDLHGCELSPLRAADTEALAASLGATPKVGARAALPLDAWLSLVRAMAPRGMVGTRLREASVRGEFEFVVESTDGGAVAGRVEGSFAMAPTVSSEVSIRETGTCMFTCSGRFAGRFRLESGRLASLRAVAVDVALRWLPRFPVPNVFAPRQAIAIELVATPAAR